MASTAGVASQESEYEILQPIGSGSFGQVYLVLHKPEQQQYVMKSIEMDSTSTEGTEAAELEVQLLSAMRHPNIVAYHDSFVNSVGHLCILMEYCEHGDIHSYLQEAKKARKVPDEARLLEWFVQITLALHALHMKKILHRDLKTQNIFLTGNKAENTFALKLGDFGIAKVLNSTTDLAKTQIGTPFYMSPELINSKPYSYKSDIWGLGCVLYEIINGQRAFDAQSLNGLALKIIKGSYTPITANCSQSTKTLIKSMLSKSPSHRPTLKEILYMSSVQPRIHAAHRHVISAMPPEARQSTEQALNQQLIALGLGDLVNAGVGPQKDRRKLMQRLERAEKKKKQEEDMLQQSTALLAQMTGRQMRDLELHRDQDWDDVDPDDFHSGAGGPAMSHRDRVLRQKERRREEAQQRFEEEARKIREENLAHQRAWVGERRDRHGGGHHDKDSDHKRPSALRLRTRTDAALDKERNQSDREEGTERNTQVSWLLDYDHVRPANLANPFDNCRPRVLNSPRRRGSKEPEPSPPPPQYGEPLPPHRFPPPAGSSLHGWRSTSEFPRRPPVHSARLESLGAPGAGSQRTTKSSWPDFYSEATFSDTSVGTRASGSLLEVDDLHDGGLSDGSDGFSYASDGGRVRAAAREQPQALRQRIEQCRAAICKHRMTIEMLRYTCAQAGAPQHTGFTRKGSAQNAPAVVQDTAARLVRRCLEGLGNDKFQAARRCLQASLDSAEPPGTARQRMVELLGAEQIGFLSLVDQLLHMERAWGLQDPI